MGARLALAKTSVLITIVVLVALSVMCCRADEAKDSNEEDKRAQAFVVPFLSDTVLGHGASNINCTLYKLEPGNDSSTANWNELDTGETWSTGHAWMRFDADSAVGSVYKLVLDTEPYYTDQNMSTFYFNVEVIFQRLDEDDFLLIPILLSPYSYSAMIGHA